MLCICSVTEWEADVVVATSLHLSITFRLVSPDIDATWTITAPEVVKNVELVATSFGKLKLERHCSKAGTETASGTVVLGNVAWMGGAVCVGD